jgi:ketosteroid isomerase-like protein
MGHHNLHAGWPVRRGLTHLVLGRTATRSGRFTRSLVSGLVSGLVWPKGTRDHAGVTESSLDRDHVEAISRYDAAWAEVDDAQRLALLKAIWAEDGVYFDPDIPEGVRGPQALSDFIAVTQSEMPGLMITTTRQVCVLGDRAWYGWACTYGDGESLDGVDFVEFAPDGRIHRLTNFYPA